VRQEGSKELYLRLCNFEFVCIRVLNGFFDLRDHDFIGGNAFGNDAFNLNAREGEEVGDFRDSLSV
jgi:hypothetical protein